MIRNFANNRIRDYFVTRTGMATADNDAFLRFWFEVSNTDIFFNATDLLMAVYTGKKWFPYNKGGDYRRWYGNNEYVVNWLNDGKSIKNNIDPKTNRVRSHNYNGEYSFSEGLTWTELSSGLFACRYCEKGFLFDSAGAKAFQKGTVSSKYALAFLNSNTAQHYLSFLAPTLHYKPGDIDELPLIINCESAIETLCKNDVKLSAFDWDSFEISWDFKKHPLI